MPRGEIDEEVGVGHDLGDDFPCWETISELSQRDEPFLESFKLHLILFDLRLEFEGVTLVGTDKDGAVEGELADGTPEAGDEGESVLRIGEGGEGVADVADFKFGVVVGLSGVFSHSDAVPTQVAGDDFPMLVI